MMKEKLLEKFQDVYGDTNGTKVYFAPGRVNLFLCQDLVQVKMRNFFPF